MARPRTLALVLLIAGCAPEPDPGGGSRFELVYAQAFEDSRALADFHTADPTAWRWVDDGARPAMDLARANDYSPPHRSPYNIALLREPWLADFDFQAELKQTGPEYDHRDLCVFFGFEDVDRFYYAHLATTPDPNAHNVFIVDRADRAPLGPVGTVGVDWGTDQWHTIRVERRVDEGTIRVFFDDLVEPVLAVSDDRIGRGRIGFGSFDDVGRFTDIQLWASDATAPPDAASPFPASD